MSINFFSSTNLHEYLTYKSSDQTIIYSEFIGFELLLIDSKLHFIPYNL